MWHKVVKILILLFAVTISVQYSEVSAGETGIYTWNPPTTNTDGSKLTDLAGYRLYWGKSTGNYLQSMNVPACTGCPEPLGTEAEVGCIGGLDYGTTYYIVATAYDTSGNESAYSNEVVETTGLPSSQLGNIYILGASIARVDGYDLNLINHCYGTAVLGASCTPANVEVWKSCNPADINGDGKVDGADLSFVTGNFGRQW